MTQQAFRAIRLHHVADHITLMTIPNLVELATSSGVFDAVIVDRRARSLLGYWQIAQGLRRAHFDFVYDLQGNRRTAWYWRLLWPNRPCWSGPVAGCSHPRPPRPANQSRTEWLRVQLQALGVKVPSTLDVAWLKADISKWKLPMRMALLVAGGSAHRPGKRWPVAHYARVAEMLVARGITPVLIGTTIDAVVTREIQTRVPATLDLSDQTSVAALASLARMACGALGNDTGPMHVVAATGCPSVVLFSNESDPHFVAPTGPCVEWLQRGSLSALGPDEVMQVIDRCWRW